MSNQPGSGPSQGLTNALLGSTFASAALLVITFLTGIVLARILGVVDRGYYGTVMFAAQFGVVFFLLSVNEAFTINLRKASISNNKSVPLVLTAALVLSVLFLVVLAFGLYLGLLDFKVNLSEFQLVLITATLVFIGFLTHLFISVESADLAFSRINFDRVLSPLLFLCLVAIMGVLGTTSVTNLLVAFIFSKLPVLFFRFWRFRDSLFGQLDKKLAFSTIRLAPRLHIAMGAMTLSSNADRIVAVSLWPPDWLGYYFVAFSAAGAGMSLAAQAIQISLLPHMAGLPIEEKRPLFERSFRLALTAGFVVAIPVWVVSPWIVPLIYGEEFAPASTFVRGLVLAMAFTPAIWTVNVANRSAGRGRPGVEMACASLTIFGLGYLLTGFTSPSDLFGTMIIANIALILAGLRHLHIEGSFDIGAALIPGPKDVVFLVDLLKKKLSERAGST